jgi:hypothetical protein
MDKMQDKEMIFVTGCPRSGTTAVGDVLSMILGCKSLYEPFSFYGGLDEVKCHYPIIDDGLTKIEFDNIFKGIKKLKLNYKNRYSPRIKWYRKLAKIIVGGRNRFSYLRAKFSRNNSLVVKDPNAAFLLEQFYKKNVKCVICCRGVKSISASVKRMKWPPESYFHNERLKAKGLFSVDVETFALADTPAKRGALIWLLIYGNIALIEKVNKVEFFTLNNNKLISDSVKEYKSVCDYLGVELSKNAEKKITEIYSVDVTQPNVPSDKVHGAARNLSAANTYYSELLTKEECVFADNIKNIFIDEFGSQIYQRYFV